MTYLAIKEVLKDPFQQHIFCDWFQDKVKDYIALKMQATLIARSVKLNIQWGTATNRWVLVGWNLMT